MLAFALLTVCAVAVACAAARSHKRRPASDFMACTTFESSWGWCIDNGNTDDEDDNDDEDDDDDDDNNDVIVDEFEDE
jgi:hypothetical protein